MISTKNRENLIYILLPIMLGYMYFLVYAPIKVSDEQLLIITTIFTAFVIGIPLISFGDFDEQEPLRPKETNNNNKKEKNQNTKQEKNEKNHNNENTSFTKEEDEWYKILESFSGNTDAQIKSNFKRLAKKYHPDIIQGKNLDKDFVDLATTKFKEINKAYENIKKLRKL